MNSLLISTGRHDLSYLTPLKDALADATLVELKMPHSDSRFGATEIALATASRAANYMVQHNPNHIVVIGDRAETLAICTAATILRIPIAHLHGGEVTEGAIDNVCRHAISQLARWHFVAHEDAASILRYMNVPGDIYVTGSPAIDLMMRKPRTRTVGNDVILAYHAETMSETPPIEQIKHAAKVALRNMPEGGRVIWTGTNPDAGGKQINDYMEGLGHPYYPVYDFTAETFWDALAGSRCMVGNSSSGVIEAPSLGVPWVEIGNRQKGRARCLYGDGKACARIAKVLDNKTRKVEK